MRKIYVTESQITEAFGMGLSYFNSSNNIPQIKCDSEITTNSGVDGKTEVTTDKINSRRSPRTYFGSRKTPNTVIKCSLEKKKTLNESNKDLENDIYEIPDELYRILQQNLRNVGNKKNVEGIMRLKNLVNNRGISYQEMYRLKNHFENTPKQNSDFMLLGGEKMKRWVDEQLKTATTISRNSKAVMSTIKNNAYQKEGGTKNSGNGQAHTEKKNGVTFNFEK